MRVGIDARLLGAPGSGVAGYVVNLIQAMAATDSELDFFLFVDRRLPLVEVLDLPSNFHLVYVPRYPIGQLQDQFGLAMMIRKTRVHVFHAMHHDATPLLANVPLVVTAHDIAPMDFYNPAPLHRLYYRLLSEVAFRRASCLICDSASTGHRIERHFPSCRGKWVKIYLGCDSFFRVCDTLHDFSGLAGRLGIHRPFILYVGSFARRKNLPGMVDAFSIVRRHRADLQFVIVGGPSGRDDVFPAELPDRVIVAGRLTREELRALYNSAELLIFTTLYEGFGVPVLEAMACGCPVVTSPVTSLPEVAGDAALYAAPHRPAEIARQAMRILSERDLRQTMVEKGLGQAARFDWEAVAYNTLFLYQRMAAGKGHR